MAQSREVAGASAVALAVMMAKVVASAVPRGVVDPREGKQVVTARRGAVALGVDSWVTLHCHCQGRDSAGRQQQDWVVCSTKVWRKATVAL